MVETNYISAFTILIKVVLKFHFIQFEITLFLRRVAVAVATAIVSRSHTKGIVGWLNHWAIDLYNTSRYSLSAQIATGNQNLHVTLMYYKSLLFRLHLLILNTGIKLRRGWLKKR
jgi:hypothetical protein